MSAHSGAAEAPTGASSDGADAVDGRRARRDRNRIAVLDAVIELFSEGELEPGPEAVAERSGVSLRSVYRYFSDPAELRRAATERHLERVVPLAHITDIGKGPLSGRIDRFVQARVRMHETAGPAMRASRLAAIRNPVHAERYARSRRMLREQADRQFEPELREMAAPERLAVRGAIDALAQLEGLDVLRVELGLSSGQAEDALRTSLLKLLS